MKNFVSFSAIILLTTSAACVQAQVGVGVRQGNLTTGGYVRVGPVVTNGGQYVRTGISTGFSQLIDVQTFSPVQNFPGLVPLAPIGFGAVGPVRMGGNGMTVGAPFAGSAYAANRPAVFRRQVPTVAQFMTAAFRRDGDGNEKLDRDELELVAAAALTELKNTPGFNPQRLIRIVTPGQTAPSAPDLRNAFVERSLQYDGNADEVLDRNEARRMATALIKALL